MPTVTKMPVMAVTGIEGQITTTLGNDSTRFTAPLPNLPIKYSRGESQYDNQPDQRVAYSWNELWEAFANDRGTAKGQQYVCGSMKLGEHPDKDKYPHEATYRRRDGAEDCLFIPFDCDHIPADIFGSLLALLDEFEGCSYTTSSHTPDNPRARVFVALSRPVIREERMDVGKAFERYVESRGVVGIYFDAAVYQTEQMCYLPLKNADFKHHKGGVALDVDALLGNEFDGGYGVCDSNSGLSSSNTTRTDKTHQPKLTNEQLEIALFHIDPDDEQAWSDTANIMARVYGEDGREYFHLYSRRSSKYDYDNCEERYDRALREAAERSKGYGTKRLIELASNHPDWPKVEHKFLHWGEILPIDQLFGGVEGVGIPKQLELPLSHGISEYSQGDIRNAQIFANSYRGVLVYVPAVGKWLHWGETGWKWCDLGEEMRYAKAIAQGVLHEAVNTMGSDPDKGKRMLTQALASQNVNKLEAMMKLARSEPDMSILAGELDKDPMLLGVENGVVDLRTGALLARDPRMLITKSCRGAFIKDSGCPQWLKFLDQVFEGDQDTIDCVQRTLGYTLTGLNTEEIIVFCVGYGSNGKSVFGNTTHMLMGDYAATTGGSILVARKAGDNSPRPDIAGLSGCRYLGINETQAGDKLDEQGVKMLAGREPITARFLYGTDFTFTPQFTPWLRTNHKPRIHGTDDGIWRRIIVLPFNRRFTDEEKDPHLERKLMEEGDGILAWMIEGCLKYQNEGGLKPSAKMKAEMQSYRDDSDLFGEFLADEVVLDPSMLSCVQK